VVKLLNHRNILLTKAGKGELIIAFNNIKYNIHSGTNLTIVDEMLLENAYNVSVTEPCVVLDIGMNVGYASLYFSAIPNVKKVYAFEPFGDTFLIAQQNFVLNENYSRKIQPYNYGISNYTGTVEVPMLEAGSVGASTEKSFISDQNIQSAKSITVNVRDILDVLKEIRGDNPRMNIGLKIDCEGEEYNILEAMHAHNGFERVVFLCIEWHLKGQDRIKEILTSNNFIVFDNPKNLAGEYGLIYGFRTITS
jgi:FkbM family methyltransferase